MTQISNLTTVNDKPKWLNLNPAEEFKGLLENGEKNILLYGPPRTGKTYVVRNTVPKEESVTIQMHDGWTYEDLVLGLTPVNGDWEYRKGPLLQSILDHKKYIILEEINRTDFAQAIGDVFTLIESGYRDGRGSVVLKDGTSLTIPSDITFIFTMNTLDKSVTIIDDALFGRVASVEFPPMVEELENLLQKNEVDEDTRSKIRDIFNIINASYPMGHAFFVDYKGGDDFIAFYSARIRPVLQKHLENLRQQELSTIDEKVDQSFNQ
jgi:5-methylcytosine-specific restriction endonuclease McrBC GTP-binding regulatory subunit McrB